MMMKLTSEQIEAIRNVSPELADKLEAGESVTVERNPSRWEPDWSLLHGPATELKECRSTMRLLAYREEFAPGYVLPEIGETAWCIRNNGTLWITMSLQSFRCPTDVYMPHKVAEELVRKLNSGEVVL